MDLPHPTGALQASQNAGSLGHWSLQPLLYRHQPTDLPWALEQGQPSSISILCECCSHWRGPGLASHFPRTAAGLALYQQGSHQGKSREWVYSLMVKMGHLVCLTSLLAFQGLRATFLLSMEKGTPQRAVLWEEKRVRGCLGAPVLGRAGRTIAVGGSQRAPTQPPPGS